MRQKIMESNPRVRPDYILENSPSYSCGPASGFKFMTNIPQVAIKNLNKNYGKTQLYLTPEKKKYQFSEIKQFAY